MKKLLLWLSLCFILSVRSYAQEVYTKIEDRIIATDYIFEGVVIKTYPYMTADEKSIYTSNVIQITKIFKGDSTLSCGTIELITDGGQLPDIGLHGSHTLEMKVGEQGLFLCDHNTKELPQASYFPFTVPTKVGAKFEWQSFIKYLYNYNDLKAYDVWGMYDSLSQLYDLTQLLTQIPYTDCTDGHLLPPAPASPIQAYHPDSMSRYTNAQMNQVVTRLQQLASRKRQTNASRSSVTLYYNMSNVIITGTNPKYMEFDVNLKDDGSGDYLINAAPHILLPPGTFTDSVVSHGLIQVTAAGLIADTTQYYPVVPIDISATELAIAFSSVLYPTNMFPLTAGFQQIAHVKIQMANCNGGSVSFTNQTDMLNASFYSTAPDTSGGFNQYDAVNATQSFTVPGCSAHITSFDPQAVNGGVKDILNIHGYLFGNSRGNGNLFFHNANAPFTGMNVPLDSLDYISWSDTLITIRVPSVDSGGQRLPVGSGLFQITTASGEIDTSGMPLTVFYSLINIFDSTSHAKCPVYLANRSGNGGYQFFVDTSVSHNPAIYGCVQKAMQDWVCATGVNFTILRDTFGLPNIHALDGINLITMGPQAPSNLATCYLSPFFCRNPDAFGYFKEEDLIISNDSNLVWFTDTTGTLSVPHGQTDLYHVLLHELGHGVGHNHVIDPTKIMYYSVPSIPLTGLPASQRIVNIRVDAPATDGGVKEVDNSTISSNFSPTCIGVPMIPEYICVIPNSINYVKGSSNILVYPNPFNTFLNIESDNPVITILLNSIEGRNIGSWEYDGGNTKIMIELPKSMSSGFYILNIQTQNGISTKKLIHE